MPTPPEDLFSAVAQFRVWIRWYLDKYQAECPSQADLARKITVDRATITNLLRQGSTYVPKFQTVWAFSKLVGFPIDYILSRNPPGVRKGQYGSTRDSSR